MSTDQRVKAEAVGALRENLDALINNAVADAAIKFDYYGVDSELYDSIADKLESATFVVYFDDEGEGVEL